MKCVRDDEGLKFWKGNKLVAYLDEQSQLFAMPRVAGDSAFLVGHCDNEREARSMLKEYDIS